MQQFEGFFVLRKLVLILLLLDASAFATAANAEEYKVGVIHNPPILYHGESGELSGLAIDVLDDVASKNGFSLNYVPGTWLDLIKGLPTGEVDLLPGVAYSQARAARYDFNKVPLVVNWGVLYRTPDEGFSSVTDLHGMKIAAIPNTTHTRAFLKLLSGFDIQPVIVEVADYSQAFKTVADGKANYAVVSRLFGIVNSGDTELVQTGMNFNPVEVRFIATKGKNRGLLDAIDVYLQDAKMDPNSNYHNFLRQRLTTSKGGNVKDVFIWIAVFASVALMLAVIVAWSLKREVNKRTHSLRESESKLQEAQIIARTGDYQWDIKAGTVFCSPGLNRLLKKADATPRELEEAIQNSIHPDDGEAFREWIKTGLEAGKTELESKTFRLYCEDDSYLYAESLLNIEYENGEPIKALGIFRDISEQVRADEALRHALESAVSSNFAKSNFLATMSHELRTPLNAILGFAQLLLVKDIEGNAPLSKRQSEYVDNISTGGTHLLNLVNDILDVSQIESDRIELTHEKIDVCKIVAECLSQIYALAERRGIEINNLTADGPGYFIGADSLRVRQVLINLMSNAINYNRENGSITISAEEKGGKLLRINVTDTGVGIPEKYKGEVFQAFNRLGADPLIYREGTGIGLTVTKLLIERMGGKIGFSSEEGLGSTFWFELRQTRA